MRQWVVAAVAIAEKDKKRVNGVKIFYLHSNNDRLIARTE